MENNKEMKLLRLQRAEGKLLSESLYNVFIGLTLLWGILLNVLMATVLSPYILRIDYRVVLVIYFVMSFGCAYLVYHSSSPALSFLGFTGLAVAMGLLLTTYLTMFSGGTIYSAFLATGIVVVAMMLVSMFFPTFFLSLGRVLVLTLIGAIVIELIGGLLLHLPMGWMDYVVVVIFAGYVGYDWAKAQAYPKTLDNAIDSAADIYVDIINIFIRILSIMGDKKD